MALFVETEFYARASLVRRVREHMRDYVELNTLTDGEESSDAMIHHTIDALLERINSVPPPIGYLSVALIPLDMAIDWCVSWLLESAATLMVRNDLQFSAGGLTVQMDHYRTYFQIAAERRRRFDLSAKEWKSSINMQQAVDDAGGVYSDWSIVNASRYFWRDALQAL